MGRPTLTGLEGNITEKERASFWNRVDRSAGVTACWPWTGGTSLSGYGVMRLQGHFINASRAAWIINNGAIPAGEYVLHHCDQRLCVNPAHLFIGTQSANMADMTSKGRRGRGYRAQRHGEMHQAARLSDATVAAIRADMEAGGKQRHVALRYGVSHTYVGQLVRGEKRV